MAWETGNAAGHNDLINKLVAFLSTNADLVAAGQQWDILRNSDLPFTTAPLTRIGFNYWDGSSTAYSLTAPDPWPITVPATQVKMKITGTLIAPSTGNYVFSLLADDYAELYIDGALAAGVYTSNLTNTFASTATIALTAGNHTLEVRFIQASTTLSTNPGLSLGWRKPGDGALSLIPAANYSGLSIAYGYSTVYNSSSLDLNAAMDTREVIVKGPGLAGAEDIYVTMRTHSSAQGDTYNVVTQYATGYDPTKATDQQPGAVGITNAVYSLMWNQTIKYWFIANGRRFIVIAKISTTYASLYGGFILPYGLPSEMPYPIAVGANSPTNSRWSIQNSDNSSFWNPAGIDSNTASLALRRTDGTIEYVRNIYTSGASPARTYPYGSISGGTNQVQYRNSADLSYALEPVAIYSTAGGGNVWGELDGVFCISGFNNASENTQVVDGKTYLVVQGAYRTTATDYAAILLE